MTDKGRFVNREEAHQLATGSGGEYNHLMLGNDKSLTSESLHEQSDPDYLSHDERTMFDNLKEQYHMTDAEALSKVRESRLQKRQSRILANPEVQEKIKELRQQAVDKWVKDKKAELANPVSQETKRTATEPTIPQEVTHKYVGDDAHLNKSLDDDLQEATGERPKTDEVNPDHEKYQELVKGMKTAEDKFVHAGEIEKLKNKYGGMIPPEKMPIPNAIDTAVDCILAKLL